MEYEQSPKLEEMLQPLRIVILNVLKELAADIENQGEEVPLLLLSKIEEIERSLVQ